MFTAANKGHADLIRLLHEQLGASVNQTYSNERTPMHLAAARGQVELFRCCKSSVPPSLKQKKKDQTPLQVAFRYEKSEALEELLSSAKISCSFVCRDNPELAQVLLLYGADPLPALTQIREQSLEGSAVATMERWPRV